MCRASRFHPAPHSILRDHVGHPPADLDKLKRLWILILVSAYKALTCTVCNKALSVRNKALTCTVRNKALTCTVRNKALTCISGGSAAYRGNIMRGPHVSSGRVEMALLSWVITLSISPWPVRKTRMSPAALLKQGKGG